MKTLVTLVLVALICFLCHNSEAAVAPNALFQQCCPKCAKMRIPKEKVKHMAKTSSDCKLNAIIVKTVCNKTICLDGNLVWAQKMFNEFKEKPFSTINTTCH
uniref:C-C motif chemokine 17-like n=1 Tax=Scatophagus argus TaxID=75038 RepID=UPI001ED82F08|nr:C-C motif chemokine 17-like [Scatophagus argus]